MQLGAESGEGNELRSRRALLKKDWKKEKREMIQVSRY
jgi:hypothetical protein